MALDFADAELRSDKEVFNTLLQKLDVRSLSPAPN